MNHLIGQTRQPLSHLKAHQSAYARAVFVVALLIGAWVAAPADGASRRPPILIPAGYDGLDPSDKYQDAGATPDEYLFQEEIDNNEWAATPSPYPCQPSAPSRCQVFKYTDMLQMFCNTLAERNAYTWAARSDENAFIHVYPQRRTRSNRFGSFNSPGCGTPTSVYLMNPGDALFNSYLYANDWTNTGQRYFPGPPAIPQIGIYEDDTKVLGELVVGKASKGGRVSTEYGSGFPSGFANRIGNSSYAQRTDYETALALFSNAACQNKCLPMAYDGAGPSSSDLTSCSIIRDGHCHSPYFANFIDDQVNLATLCSALARPNLKYAEMEVPILHYNHAIANAQTLIGMINTFAGLQAHTTDNCRQMVLVDFELGYGPGGVGDLTGGIRVRTLITAMHWLVPNPQTGIPDRIIYKYDRIGRTITEVPYYFEETLVPYGPEEIVTPFSWNGTIPTVGGGCPTTDGDSGGAISLLVQCVGSAGIYCQQYQDLYINGTAHGPAAACVNTSSSAEHIASSWFARDPISTYGSELKLSGGELSSVPYRSVPGGSISLPCTNAAYCTGSSSLASQSVVFHRDGSAMLCGRCGVVLLALHD